MKSNSGCKTTVLFKMHLNHIYTGPLTKSGTSDRKDGEGLPFTSAENLTLKCISGCSVSGALDDSMRKE